MSHRSRLSGVRVLVVDDARYVLDVVTDMLQCNGANVTAVDSAEEALDILQRERPDVLLSDLSMPGCPAKAVIGCRPLTSLGAARCAICSAELSDLSMPGKGGYWLGGSALGVGGRPLTSLGAARCAICSAELSDAAERFCGGDRCVRVFWSRAWLRPVSSHRGLCAGSSAAGPDSGADGESSLSEKEGGSL